MKKIRVFYLKKSKINFLKIEKLNENLQFQRNKFISQPTAEIEQSKRNLEKSLNVSTTQDFEQNFKTPKMSIKLIFLHISTILR